MEQTQAFENRVLERLNAGKTVRLVFLITAVELLTEAVNILVLQGVSQRRLCGEIRSGTVTRRRWTAGRSLGTSETDLRSGVLSRPEYEDAELLMALREELNHDGNEYAFTDDDNSRAVWRTAPRDGVTAAAAF